MVEPRFGAPGSDAEAEHTSHELRTPLNAVIGFASLIEQGNHESDQEAREFAARIRESAEHLLGLLNGMLDPPDAVAGVSQEHATVGDLRAPVRDAVEAAASVAASRGLGLEADLPEEPLPARFDPARVRQAVLNLLGNALQHTDKRTVGVRAWRDAASGEARVEIADAIGRGTRATVAFPAPGEGVSS